MSEYKGGWDDSVCLFVCLLACLQVDSLVVLNVTSTGVFVWRYREMNATPHMGRKHRYRRLHCFFLTCRPSERMGGVRHTHIRPAVDTDPAARLCSSLHNSHHHPPPS